ncbi:hypothetical protein TrST_g6737 [Triparma strigata]|uniref:GOLD domain-containing protein n=1 Tax=Triparma strigata TaxID=1606541 RepID=A0A9W7C3H5_9STRA|nr:hypothetical protein TrST_g6737 [Triparma strigata]
MSFCSKGLFVLLLVVVVAHVSSVIHSIELPPKRGSSKCFFQTLLPGSDISLTFIPPSFTSTSPKKIVTSNLKSSTISETNYRVTITSPSKNIVYTKEISNKPDSDKMGADSITSLGALDGKKGKEEDSGDYQICFYDNSRYGVGGGRVGFDLVEYGVDDKGEVGVKKEHVDPVLDMLEEASKISSNIIKEMDYMHRREIRMHQTSESTNSRITAFAALSILTLMGVCFFQVVYLRGYFKRKKLL